MQPPSPRTGRATTALALLGIFALALIVRYPIADIPLERDEGEYAYIAQRWLAGEVPYKESFDQKPPGTFAVYALFIATLGPSVSALHWGAQLYTLGTLTVLFFLGRRLFSATAGALAAALCAFMTTADTLFGNAANTEIFMILPLTAGMLTTWLTVERNSSGWALATGALGGAALLCKQVALFNALLFAAWVFWRAPRRWLLSALVLLGLALVLLLVVGYFVLAGAGSEFYDCVIGYNLSYASRVPLSQYPEAFGRVFRHLLVTFWPICLLAAASAMAMLVRVFSPLPPKRDPVVFVFLWLTATCLATATGGQFFPHYFIATLPPLCLIAGAGLVSLTRRTGPSWRRVAVPALIVIACIAYGVWTAPWYYFRLGGPGKCRLIYGDQNPFAESLAIAEFVAENTPPEAPIFVAGSEPEIYYYAQRKCAGRYIFIFPVLTPFPGVHERQQEALEELRRDMPAMIVTVPTPASLRNFSNTPPYYLRGVDQLLADSYEVTAVLPFTGYGHAPLLTGKDAACFYEQHPITFANMPADGYGRSASMVVWRLRRPVPQPG
jgi:MFS family permease